MKKKIISTLDAIIEGEFRFAEKVTNSNLLFWSWIIVWGVVALAL